jgi:hypothetical protein
MPIISTKWRAKRRPKLTQAHADVRLAWAQAHLDSELADWMRVMWSDECSVERGKGKRPVWVFRTPCQKWDKEMIDPYPSGKDASVMVWAGFSGEKGRSKLIIMERDTQARRGGYSARSYITALEEGLVDYYEEGIIFMQDNAGIHTAHITRAWLTEHNVELIDWPPYSPDMNPIENLWFWLKERLLELHPELLHMPGAKPTIVAAMEPLIQEAWEAIPEDYLIKCWSSMKRRCEAVIAAEGWYTKY